MSYALELDFRNKIETFHSIGMCDPFETKTSIKKAIQEMKTADFYSQVYPDSVVGRLMESTRNGKNIKPPKCVFLIKNELLVKIVRAVALYGQTDTKEAFLLRFGLLEDE